MVSHAEYMRAWKKKNPDKVKANQQRYYEKHRGEVIGSTRKAYLRTVAKRRHFVDLYLANHPCTDCGEADPEVLEFDHVPERGKKVTSPTNHKLLAGALENLMAEIAKCDVVCANCHTRRTRRRGQWPRRGGD